MMVDITLAYALPMTAISSPMLWRFALRQGLRKGLLNYPTVSKGTERMRLTPSPAHSHEEMANLIHAPDELRAACPVTDGTYVRLAAEWILRACSP